ncbi:DUF4440 domain-containing protein [Deinococcus sp.]|uniref:DUF4440 domain-containing protein n=1 Tax=Deinococcus sp. TaxID=47478 RepID=UPI002869A02D|nr:DUF4440 domain-containing protein [Deinococcus sp.]
MSHDTATLDLRQIGRDRLHAIVVADRERLEALHHTDFLLCTPGGVMWDRTFYVSQR